MVYECIGAVIEFLQNMVVGCWFLLRLFVGVFRLFCVFLVVHKVGNLGGTKNVWKKVGETHGFHFVPTLCVKARQM